MPSSIPEYDVISFSEFMTTVASPEGDSSEKEELQLVLDTYSCPKDVESFLKYQAIEQYVRRAGMSYLMFAADTRDLVGYFTLASRPFTIPLSVVSNSQRRKLRCCGLREISHRPAMNNASQGGSIASAGEDSFYEASAFLIGQLGRNYAEDITSTIRGSELLDLAFEQIYEIQDLAGGRLAIVEAEDREPLLRFYENNGFRRFGERIVSSTQSNSEVSLIQMFKLIGTHKYTLAAK